MASYDVASCIHESLPYATSLLALTAPALNTILAPGVIFQRFSILVPSASAPPTSEQGLTLVHFSAQRTRICME